MTSKNSVKVVVCFHKKDFPSVCQDAVRAGLRHGTNQVWKASKVPFSDKQVANTTKIAKFMKFCYKYWKESEAERLTKHAELAERERQLQEEKKKWGKV